MSALGTLGKWRGATPVYELRNSVAAARKFVEDTMDGIEGGAITDAASGKFIPTAYLRRDQGFLVARLEERGIKCVVDPASKTHVSELMIAAGLRELELCAVLKTPHDQLVKKIFLAMERER